VRHLIEDDEEGNPLDKKPIAPIHEASKAITKTKTKGVSIKTLKNVNEVK
jgi:hypothetical protein